MSRNRIDHLYQEVQFSEKRPQRPENGIKDGFEEMGHEYFCPESQDHLFRCSLLPNIFRWKDLRSGVPFTLQPDFPKTFCKWETTNVYENLFTLCQRVAQKPFQKMTILGAVQLRSVTEIAPKSPFLSVNRSPNRYCFRLSARASLKIQIPDVNSCSFFHTSVLVITIATEQNISEKKDEVQ